MSRKGMMVFCFVAALSWPHIGEAEITGTKLLVMCESAGDPMGQGYCLGFIMGVWATGAQILPFADEELVIDKRDGEAWVVLPRSICTGPEVKLGEVKQVVLGWLREHPEKLLDPAYPLVLMALGKAFPCPGYNH